jgi:uncharacterized protein (TIGR00725 family)
MENKFKIGFMGKAGRGKTLPDKLLKLARDTGREIAFKNAVLVTGACMGTPQEAALGAREANGEVIAFSPAKNIEEHLNPPISYPKPPEGVELRLTGKGKEGRIVDAISFCDAVISCSGSVGTSIEMLMAYQQGMVLGLLKGSGGATDLLANYIDQLGKKTNAVIIEESDPKTLVEKIIIALEERKKE